MSERRACRCALAADPGLTSTHRAAAEPGPLRAAAASVFEAAVKAVTRNAPDANLPILTATTADSGGSYGGPSGLTEHPRTAHRDRVQSLVAGPALSSGSGSCRRKPWASALPRLRLPVRYGRRHT